MSSVSWTYFASPQLLGWTFGLHCKQPCGCGENTNDGAAKNSQVLTFGENKKDHLSFCKQKQSWPASSKLLWGDNTSHLLYILPQMWIAHGIPHSIH